jgi:hypothetical protein
MAKNGKISFLTRTHVILSSTIVKSLFEQNQLVIQVLSLLLLIHVSDCVRIITNLYDSISCHTATASKKIKSHQLLSSLKKTSSAQVQTLKKQLAKVNKHQAVLQQPLQKPQAEKVSFQS